MQNVDHEKARRKKRKKSEKREEGRKTEHSSDDDSSMDTVNVDFEFFDPKPEDYHGVKVLLKSYLGNTSWDLGGLVDAILSQATVGTTIKAGEEDSPIGVISVLNVGMHKDHNFMQTIRQFLYEKCSGISDTIKLSIIFDEYPGDVGLLISERLINAPEELAPPLYRGLFDEIAWATEDEPTQNLRDSFKFRFYLVLSRVFQQLPRKKKKQHIGCKGDVTHPGELIYPKFEDEILHQLSYWHCKFPVTSDAVASREVQGLKQFHLAMILDNKQIETFKTQLCTS